MAATVNLYETNGAIATPTTTLLTNLNFSNVDTPNTVVSAVQNPLVIPASGTSYSLTKWIRIGVSAWGGSNSIGTLKRWNSSSSPWATTKGIGDSIQRGVAAASYPAYGAIVAYGHAAGSGAAISTMPDIGGGAICGGAIWSGTVGSGALQMPTTAPTTAVLGVAGVLATDLLVGGDAPQYSDYWALGMWFTKDVTQGDAGAQTISYQWNEG